MMYFLIPLAFVAYWIWRAPEGWQDANGFHYGIDTTGSEASSGTAQDAAD